jgi:hypothetical protein
MTVKPFPPNDPELYERPEKRSRGPVEPAFLELNTFGKTPACIYLADYLNKLKNPILNRKIGKRFSEVRKLINELVRANEAEVMTLGAVGSFVDLMRERHNESMEYFAQFELVHNLVNNIVLGEFKSIIRKLHILQRLRKFQAHLRRDPTYGIKWKGRHGSEFVWTVEGVDIAFQDQYGIQFVPITIDLIDDPVTAEVLQERSRAKLTRRKKINSLYPVDRQGTPTNWNAVPIIAEVSV